MEQCEACVTDAGTMNEEDIAPQALRERSLAELLGASRVVAPSQDTARRLNRHFPLIQSEIVAWEDDAAMPSLEPRPIVSGDLRRVCVVGAIGMAKGYEVLLACARDAAMRNLNLEFCLVGYSCDDDRLMNTGRVHITRTLRRARRSRLDPRTTGAVGLAAVFVAGDVVLHAVSNVAGGPECCGV